MRRGKTKRRRVAVTGIGIVSAAGCTAAGLWQNVVDGASAIHSISRFDASAFRCRIGAEVEGFDFSPYLDGHRTARLDRFSQFAVAASSDALADAGLEASNASSRQAAVYLGSALGGIAFGEEQHERYLDSGIRSVAPGLALSIFVGAAASNVAIEFGFRGPSISNANSCASGAIAIGEAFHLVRDGDMDLVLAGGVECPLAPLTFGSFSLIRAMSTRNDDPESSCRPFDRDRDGFVMGEGAAVLLLEEMEHARRRGAAIKAELLGYATTNDAHHMTVPRPDGSEAARAMTIAMKDANVEAHDVGYVNAHATGTSLGDAAEAAALRSVFGGNTPPVSGTKAIHGHALGATPAIEAAITVMALSSGFLPATTNLETVDSDCEVNHVAVGGTFSQPTFALSNAFGFGGINAALVMGRCDQDGHVQA